MTEENWAKTQSLLTNENFWNFKKRAWKIIYMNSLDAQVSWTDNVVESFLDY